MKQNCNSQQFHEIFRKFQKSTSFFFQFLQSYILCIQQTITTYLLRLRQFRLSNKFVRIQVTRRTLL